MNYHLEVLNDKEFESLSKDLLEKELDLSLQIFKSGRDGGIDLRYSGKNNTNDIIVQAKAYTKSPFSSLKRSMENEKKKMDKLEPAPKRYILTTTCGLSPQEAHTLYCIMQPHMNSTDDVFGRERIESLISKYPDIEQKHFKLWLTSSNVLSTILHNAVQSQSDFYKEKILEKTRLYVRTQSLEQAFNILHQNKLLIIKGDPGVGKTTLAYILICKLLGEEYQLITIDDKIDDASSLLSPDPKVKQVFFFDDFLGSNIFHIQTPSNTEHKLKNFIELITSRPNKLLILTTRTTILNQAKDNYEHFNRSSFDKKAGYELKLSKYSKYNKAKILYNHIYHNSNRDGLNDVFFEDKNYLKIINHKNYFPRLIEFITNPQNFDKEYHKSFDNFIFSSLQNPEEIWKTAFEKQLTDEDRFLLLSLFSFAKSRVSIYNLKSAFDARYKYEIKENGFTRQTNAFQTSLKILTKSFINSVKIDETNYFELSNPSIADFLINYLRKNNEERDRILYSIAFADQLNGFFSMVRKDKIILDSYFLNEYYIDFKKLIPSFQNISSPYAILDTLHLFTNFFISQAKTDIETFHLYLNKLTKAEKQHYVTSSSLINVLKSIARNFSNDTKKIVIKNWGKFISMLTYNASTPEDLAAIRPLHELYGVNLEDTLIRNEGLRGNLESKISELFIEYAHNSSLDSREDDILQAYEYGKSDMIENIFWDLYCEDFFPIFDMEEYFEDFHHDYYIDYDEILMQVISNSSYNTNDDSFDLHKESSSTKSENELIKELFER